MTVAPPRERAPDVRARSRTRCRSRRCDRLALIRCSRAGGPADATPSHPDAHADAVPTGRRRDAVHALALGERDRARGRGPHGLGDAAERDGCRHRARRGDPEPRPRGTAGPRRPHGLARPADTPAAERADVGTSTEIGAVPAGGAGDRADHHAAADDPALAGRQPGVYPLVADATGDRTAIVSSPEPMIVPRRRRRPIESVSSFPSRPAACRKGLLTADRARRPHVARADTSPPQLDAVDGHRR